MIIIITTMIIALTLTLTMIITTIITHTFPKKPTHHGYSASSS
jgi:hypothetical protein